MRDTDALNAANERFAALAATIPGVVYQRVVKPDGDIRYTYISEGAKDLFGVPPEEIVADPQALFDCHSPEYRANFRQRLLAASRDLTMWDVEASIITRDGQHKYTHAIARPRRQADGATNFLPLLRERIFNLALFNPYPINKYNTFDHDQPNFILTIKFV